LTSRRANTRSPTASKTGETYRESGANWWYTEKVAPAPPHPDGDDPAAVDDAPLDIVGDLLVLIEQPGFLFVVALALASSLALAIVYFPRAAAASTTRDRARRPKSAAVASPSSDPTATTKKKRA
jgi:hypothetical protein